MNIFYITAIENNTKIYLSGINGPIRVLKAGEVYRHEITLPATYITSNNKIYILHVTGFGCEVGMAVLPPITCTGSKRIAFTRSTGEFFEMNILVKREGIFSFTLNGSSNLIPTNKFAPVPGSNNEWYSAQVPFTTAQVPEGVASVITNDNFSFQVGILNGNAGTTCRYGYFSSFSSLFIGDDFSMCDNQTASLDAGPGKETYLWRTGATTQKIKVNSSGNYWVTVSTALCVLTDTIRVNARKGKEDLGPDAAICAGDTVRFDGHENFSWQWSDGTTGQYLEATQFGKYWVNVLDKVGCPMTDTVLVTRLSHFNPGIKLKLNSVSVDTAASGTINLNWTNGEPQLFEKNKLFLYKRPLGTDAWELDKILAGDKFSYRDVNNLTHQESYEYYLNLTSACINEHLTSKIHNSILLTAEANSLSELITFSWNPYKEWDLGVKNYELWQKLDTLAGYLPIAVIPGDHNKFSAKLTGEGFNHQYVIRAMEASGNNESWSNDVPFKFEHPVVVPNVFTPNGDTYNQYFIRNILLYKNSQLEIIDRWGKKVFETIGYLNNWDGDDLTSGVYFYILDLKVNDVILRGPVSLVR